jgi:hypothetical protein
MKLIFGNLKKQYAYRCSWVWWFGIIFPTTQPSWFNHWYGQKKKKHYALLKNKTKGKSRKCVKIWRKAIEEGAGRRKQVH